jgi:glycosyltransferase involved in cell wall biosynthesis
MLYVSFYRRRSFVVAVVDIFSGSAFVWGYASFTLLRLLKKRCIVVLRGGNLPQYALRHPRRTRSVLSRAEIVVSPSGFLKAAFEGERADIQVIPNPVAVGKYHFRLRSTVRPRLVWLRAFHSIYCPQMVPAIVGGLVRDFPDIVCTMIGPDKGDGSLQETKLAAARWNVVDRVKVVGGVAKSEVPSLLADADVFLNTTRIDNTPISVIEAMATGLCVVSSNVGGIPHLLEDGVDAVLFPVGDVNGACEAIRQVLTEPNCAERLSGNARIKAVKSDWSVVLPQWEKLLVHLTTHVHN